MTEQGQHEDPIGWPFGPLLKARSRARAGLQPWATELATGLKPPTDRHWVYYPISTTVGNINSQTGYTNFVYQPVNPVYSGAHAPSLVVRLATWRKDKGHNKGWPSPFGLGSAQPTPPALQRAAPTGLLLRRQRRLRPYGLPLIDRTTSGLTYGTRAKRDRSGRATNVATKDWSQVHY